MPIKPTKAPAFTKWDYNKAREQITVVPEYEVNKAFIEGDHWQLGTGWVGPMPRRGEVGYSETLLEIQRLFTSRNAIAEIVERHTLGIAGNEPVWALVPKRISDQSEEEELTEQEKKEIGEAEAALTEWWDSRKLPSVIKDWVSIMLWAKRSVMRVYVPSGLTNGGSVQRAKTLNEALEYIYPEVPMPKAAKVITDSATRMSASVVTYEVIDEEGVKTNKVELCYRVPDSDTGDVLVKTMTDKDEGSVDVLLPLGGNLMVYEGERPLFVTPQIQQSQRALNLAMSIIPRSIISTGFLERVLLNAQMPGEWERDADGNPTRFVPGEYHTGPGTTNFLVGVQTEDDEGNVKISQPEIEWHDPVPLNPVVDVKVSHYLDILEEADQAHVLLNSKANASGRSREQARSDFKNSLLRTQSEIEGLGRWVIELALRLSEHFMGSPGKYTDKYRVSFICRPDAGPVPFDERSQNVDEAKDGYISKATAMSRNGIVDTEAESAIINADPKTALSLIEQQAEVIKILVDAGLPMEAAGKIVGMKEEQIKLLKEAKENDGGQTGSGGPQIPEGTRPDGGVNGSDSGSGESEA